MAMEKGKLQLRKYKFELFMKKFKSGGCGTKMLSQAFYDHFNLNKLDNQSQLSRLHATDGEHALRAINDIFKFN